MKSGTCCVIFLQAYLLMTTALDTLENAALEQKAENTYGNYSYLVFIICHSGIKVTCKTTNEPFKVITRRFATTILAQHSVAVLLRHCFEWLQHCSSIATLYWTKSRLCESSRVASPLLIQQVGVCVIQAVNCRTLSLINQ